MAKIRRKQVVIDLQDATFNNNPANLLNGDSLEDSFEKVSEVLAKNLPQKPQRLSDTTFNLLFLGIKNDGFIANGNTITPVNNIIKIGSIFKIVSNGYLDYFGITSNGKVGNAKGIFKVSYGVSIVQFTINPISLGGSNSVYVSSDGRLKVTIFNHEDVYNDHRQGIYECFNFEIEIPIAHQIASQNLQSIIVELDGTLKTFQFYFESNNSFLFNVNSLSFTYNENVSGVPTLQNNQNIIINFNSNSVKNFYRNKFVEVLDSSFLNSSSFIYSNVTSPVVNDTTNRNLNISTKNNVYFESLNIPYIVYDSVESQTFNVNSFIRNDTNSIVHKSNELNRNLGFDTNIIDLTPYNHNNSLKVGVYSNQLQLLNAMYQYPSLINYTIYGGSNYAVGMGTQRRWLSQRFSMLKTFDSDKFNLKIINNNGITFNNALLNKCKVYYKVQKWISNIDLIEEWQTQWIEAEGTFNKDIYDKNIFFNSLYSDYENGAKFNDDNDDRFLHLGRMIEAGKYFSIHIRVGIDINTNINFKQIVVQE